MRRPVLHESCARSPPKPPAHSLLRLICTNAHSAIVRSWPTSHIICRDVRAPLEWIFDACLDEDSSGHIESKEAQTVAFYLGHKGSNAEFWQKMLVDVDTDGDGKISKEEFVTWMASTSCKYPATAVELKAEMANKKNQHDAMKYAMAATTDGIDDLEEVALDGTAAATVAPSEPAPSTTKAAPVLTPAKREALAAKFKEADSDGNGQLSKEEIGDLLLLESGDATLEELWKAADKDGDGKVTMEEFVAAADAFEAAEAKLDAGLADDLGL